jgi:O-antigen ligase
MAPRMSESLRRGLFSRAGFLHFLDSVRLPLYFLMVAFVVVATALLFSRSRGGLLVTLFGIVVFMAFSGAARRKRGGVPILGSGLALLVAGYVLVSFSGDATLARFADLATAGSGRAEVHALSARAIVDRPLVGTGLGTFAETFQQYRDNSFDVLTLAYQKAHSTYLELALEGGLPAFAGMMILFAGLTGLCVRGVLVRRKDTVYPAVGLGATALVAAHSAFDFSVQIPGFALTYLMLMGIGCAQSWPTGGGTHPRIGDSRRRSGAGAGAR